MKKKLLSVFLSLAMVITMMPAMALTAFATDNNSQSAIIMLKAATSGNTAVKLSWTKADDATKYVVYGNKCGKSFKKLATVKTNKYTVKKIGKTKLVAHKFYQFKVVAYNGTTKLVTSNEIHFITGKTSGKYANASEITATTPELTLEVGQTAKVGAIVKVYKDKKHIPSEHGSKLRYLSDNTAVATVSSQGEVQANGEGTATIYIQDIGGLYCKTIVKVEDNRDRDAFEQYKQTVIAKCEALSRLTDTKGIRTMISDAKASIEALTYNKNLTLEENKAAVDAVYTNLVKKVKTQRIKQGLTLVALTAITGIIIHEIITLDPGKTYTVTFDMQGHGTAPWPQRVAKDGKVKKPTDPTEPGYKFGGWFKEEARNSEWDFNKDKVTKNTTLYAKWTADTTVIPHVIVEENTIKTGDTKIEIKDSEGAELELKPEQTQALADNINSMLKNEAVADLKDTNLATATQINEKTGLDEIIASLKNETNDETAQANIDEKQAKDVDLQMKVELSGVNVNSGDTLTITYMEFDVTPIATVTVQNGEGKTVSISTELKTLNDIVTFRLPVGSDVEGYVAVYHEGTFIGNYDVQGEGKSKYIEIKSNNFSKYGYNVLNANNVGAKIGDTLYFKFADAVAAVKNGETITLLKPATGKVTINREVSFIVALNEKEFNATVKAGEDYVLKEKNNDDTSIQYDIVSKTEIPFNFVAEEPDVKICIYDSWWMSQDSLPEFPLDLEYSTDGENFLPYSFVFDGQWKGEVITLEKAGDEVYFRSSVSNVASFCDGENYDFIFDIKGKTKAEGNIMYLLDKTGQTLTVPEYAFNCLFDYCEDLSSIENLTLPATKLEKECCSYMFEGCIGLKDIPAGLFTNAELGESCCENMFRDCTGLESLPAGLFTNAELGESCCENMFQGCTGLESLPAGLLPATKLAQSCYGYMFRYCTGLKSLPKGLLPATTLVESCYTFMFEGCAELESLPEGLLPATKMTDHCYASMFGGCAGLKSLPEGLLPATELAQSCYHSMFDGCSGLKNIPAGLLPATELAPFCYGYMFQNCAGLESLPEGLLPATVLASQCYFCMFRECSALTQAPNLPAETLEYQCYKEMFYNCASLESVTMLATDISASMCLDSWLQNAGSNEATLTVKTETIKSSITETPSYNPNWGLKPPKWTIIIQPQD